MSLPWIQVNKEFSDSQAAIELAAELKLPRPHAVGLAVSFWAWAADAAPDGLVRGAETARAVLVVDEATRHTGFADAACRCGLLEVVHEGLRIRGWDRYAKALRKGAEDARRKRVRRASGAETASVRRASGAGEMEMEMESQIERKKESKKKEPAADKRPPPDPRHTALVKALTDVAKSHDPGWKFTPRAAHDVTKLLALGEPEEVARRWERAWATDKFPRVRQLHELVSNWGHFGCDARAPPVDYSKGRISAESQRAFHEATPAGDTTHLF